MDKIYRVDRPKKEDLIKPYDICNAIFKNKELFYTKEEFEKIRKDKEEIC